MGWNITKVAVGTSSTALVAANASRRGLIFVNDSDSDIYVSRGIPAVINQGIRLNAGGGTYESDPYRDGLPIDSYFAISSGSSKNITVQEHIQ